jgi:hypothetical protein
VPAVLFGGRVETGLEGIDVRALGGDPDCARADLAALGEELARERSAWIHRNA